MADTLAEWGKSHFDPDDPKFQRALAEGVILTARQMGYKLFVSHAEKEDLMRVGLWAPDVMIVNQEMPAPA